MALSLYRIVWNWRAERVASQYGEDAPLGIG